MFYYDWNDLVSTENILEYFFVFVFFIVVVIFKLCLVGYVDYIKQESATMHHHWDIWSEKLIFHVVVLCADRHSIEGFSEDF